MLLDLGLSLNTAKLSNGKSLKTRSALAMDYLRRECYIDLVVALFMAIDFLEVDFSWETDVTFHLVGLFGLAVKLSRKT